MKKLSIAIDMGAINNGVFIVKTDNEKILDKKAVCISIDKNNINFSKKSRRENRHKDRNLKRRKLAKRLVWEYLDKDNFSNKEIELINGLLNNRGYTFLTTSSEFENFKSDTNEFINNYIEKLIDISSKEDFEETLMAFDDEKDLINYIDSFIRNIEKMLNDISNYFKSKDILIDLESLENKNVKKLKSFSFIKDLLYKSGYKNFGRNQDEVTKYLQNEEFDNTLINFSEIKKYILSLNFKDIDKENNLTFAR